MKKILYKYKDKKIEINKEKKFKKNSHYNFFD